MKMNKSVLQRGIIFILCSCILFSICPVYAFAAENQKERVVRIGVPDDTYDKINGNGKRSGYGYEYLQKIAGYTGWNYEYVDCTWENCFDKLKNDELDMIEGISYTEERAENMLFPVFQWETKDIVSTQNSIIQTSHPQTLHLSMGKRLECLWITCRKWY